MSQKYGSLLEEEEEDDDDEVLPRSRANLSVLRLGIVTVSACKFLWKKSIFDKIVKTHPP